jgi:hypothetical protein
LLIGIGMIFLLDAYVFLFLLLIIGMVYQRIIEPAESQFLRKYFGETFDQYCRTTPKYIPRVLPKETYSSADEFASVKSVRCWRSFCWFSSSKAFESPQNRPFISMFYRWLRPSSTVRTE